MNKGVNTCRGGKSSEETVLYCEGRSLGCKINTFSDINAHTQAWGSHGIPCGVVLCCWWPWAVELIYYFWLLLLTWLKSKWLQPAGNVSTLKGTVSHLSSLSHSFILFSIQFPSDSLVVCGQKDCIRISLCLEEKGHCPFPLLHSLHTFTPLFASDQTPHIK